MKQAKKPPRWVLDTNAVISALVFASGHSSRLRIAWQAHRFIPLVSKATVSELLRVLAYPKFKLTADEQRELLGDYLPWCEVVDIKITRYKLPRCRDAADLPFLQLALVAKADALVSGDRDLLALQVEFAVPIMTLAEVRLILDQVVE